MAEYKTCCRECLYWSGLYGSNAMGKCNNPDGGMRGVCDHKDYCSDGKHATFEEKYKSERSADNGT